MRWSKLFIPTKREESANVESAGQRMLLRAAYIRQSGSGIYSFLPLGVLARQKIIELIRSEMIKIGAQEFLLPSLTPLSVFEESGRTGDFADIMFKFSDRKESKLALAPTHEELMTELARQGLQSHKQLPQIWFQIQTKFRDEARPRGGLLRLREFSMKDSYSFDLDEAGLNKSFQLHKDAYCRIFDRCRLDYTIVEADPSAMCASESLEFMMPTEAGEDTIVQCSNCNYAANIETAHSALPKEEAEDSDNVFSSGPQEFHTPGIRTIKQLEEFCIAARAAKQVKTLVYKTEHGLLLVLIRGDHELNETKLRSMLACSQLEAALEDEIAAALGAHPGSLGAYKVQSGPNMPIKRIIADLSLQGEQNMFTGANKDDYHLQFINPDRDLAIELYADLRKTRASDLCTTCGAALKFTKALELAHIFKLGSHYSQKLKAEVLDSDSKRQPLYMGSYGIGVERLLAAAADRFHDKQGLKWPVSIAPFPVTIVIANNSDQTQISLAERLYIELKQSGIAVLLDDRSERAGIKFNDADLIGIPYRFTVGKKANEGVVELFERQSGERREIKLELASAHMLSEIKETERRADAY